MTEQNKTVSTSSLLQETRTFPPSAEAMKRAYADRATFMGDPDAVKMPIARARIFCGNQALIRA